VDPIGDAKGRQTVHFYLIAVIFLVFDVEAVFLFPWSVMLKDAPGHFLFIEGMIFIVLLLAAFAYAWGKGALQWND
jgi:NADH-quinone oxidoreductase subunit A